MVGQKKNSVFFLSRKVFVNVYTAELEDLNRNDILLSWDPAAEAILHKPVAVSPSTEAFGHIRPG